jgi:glycosyltransferase involved in cell wall biosynthesis
MSLLRRRRPRDPSGRRRVVVLLDSLEFLGGAETLAVDLAIGLDPERYERTLCLTHDQSHLAGRAAQEGVRRRLREAGVEVLELGRRSRFAVLPWIRLVRWLRRHRVDVLHAHKFGSNAWAVLCGRLAGVPVIVSHEHMWSYADAGALRRFVDRRWIAPGSDALIAVSTEGCRQMIEEEGVRSDRVLYVPNGVPAGAAAGEAAAARAALGLAPDAEIVGTVALLRPEKELGLLVEAVALLREERPRLRAVIVGEGPERKRLEALIAERGVGEEVILAGYREDVQGLLPGWDVAVCCSRFEGGPLSVMEYMDAGLAIVATRVGGLPELLEDGRCGLLVEPDDAAALAAGIGDLLADPERRRELGERARERKREVYSLDGWVARMAALYEERLSEPSSSQSRS